MADYCAVFELDTVPHLSILIDRSDLYIDQLVEWADRELFRLRFDSWIALVEDEIAESREASR